LSKSAPRGAALITGAPRRIGRALALAAADAGYDVAVHARELDADSASLTEAIATKGRRSHALAGDLNDAETPDRLIAEAADALGPLTLLVNNASLFEDDRLGTLTADSFDAHVGANLRAPILLAQAFATQAPANANALVVNILDQRVWKPTPQFFSYAVSKAALWEATRMMAQALAPAIRVNGIGPGPTLPSIHQSPEDFAAEAAGALLQRRAFPEEIAHALAYLIDARSVTGQMIAVDGGQHLNWRTPDIVGP
jgi:NAD(P)-dependent dehydrogenase (short-subunit alcohol dehydrogenase family)